MLQQNKKYNKVEINKVKIQFKNSNNKIKVYPTLKMIHKIINNSHNNNCSLLSKKRNLQFPKGLQSQLSD
jgi:hypothetical protein